MREPILKAVAMPPRVFWAPMTPAIVHLGVQFALMSVALVFSINPLVFIFSIAIGHLIIVIYGTREPHLSHMLMSWGRSGPSSTKNIYHSRGTKFAP